MASFLSSEPREFLIQLKVSALMPSLLNMARWEGYILVGGFLAVVSFKLMAGGINLHGLLDGDVRRADGRVSTSASAGRSQLLLLTLFSALYYVLQIIQTPGEFPKLPDALLGVLGLSQSVYLLGKAKNLLIGPLRDFFNRRPL